MNLSYSAYRLFQKCPVAYRLRYVDRLRPVRLIDNRKYLVGSVCHSCLHRWIVEAQCEPAWMSTIVEQEIGKFLAENKIICDLLFSADFLIGLIKKHVIKIQEGYFALGLHKKQTQSELLVEIYDARSRGWLKGRIDLYEPEANIIYDLKATTDESWFDREQGLFYALIVGLKTGKRVMQFGQFVPLRPEIVLMEKFDTRELEAIHSRVEWAVKFIQNNVFKPTKDKKACQDCEMREVCKSYKKVST
jgi:CRISPR/Cas system-associated exonuclease Cas4 (RecB family)